MNYKVHPKESLYFGLRVFSTMVILGLIAILLSQADKKIIPVIMVFVFYMLLIVLFLVLKHGLFMGYIRGNGIKISECQFPEIHKLVQKYSLELNIKTPPSAFIIQGNGLLNAFAARLSGRDYVVFYSDIIECAYQQNADALAFVVGHELGHVKRKHNLINLLLFPTILIPFLNQAYSRACEFTCDNIGKQLSPDGFLNGLLILAVGKNLYKRINLDSFINQSVSESGFWIWLAEKLSTHPLIPRRLQNLNGELVIQTEPAFASGSL